MAKTTVIDIINSHGDSRRFCISYIAMFLDDLTRENIITAAQRNQAKEYILKCQGLPPFAKKKK